MLHPGTGARRLAAACLLCGWLVAGSLTAAPAPLTVLAPAGDSGSGYSVAPLFSADGRQLVFVSRARNLVTNDDLAPHMDVFVRDLQANRTALVSVNTSGIGGGNDPSGAPAISANGQFIAFESAASNLVAGDTNNASDIFVRDLAAGGTVLASVASSGAAGQGRFATSAALERWPPTVL